MSTWNFNSRIATALRESGPDEALDVFEKLQRSRTQPDAVTYSLLIKASTRDKWWKVLDYLTKIQHLQRKDIIPYSASISFLSKVTRWEAALQAFTDIPFYQLRISPDAGIFAAAFMACRLGASWEISLTLIQKASFFRVSLDDVCRNSLVSALVQGNQILAAGKLAQSTSNFNSILMSLSKGLGKGLSNLSWPVTLQMLQRMQELIVEPNLGTFKAAASASKDRPDLILPIFQNLKLSQLDQISLNMLVSSLERCHRWQHALWFLHEQNLKDGMAPDLAAYNSAISACAKVARWSIALQLANEIPRSTGDEFTLGSLVSACYRGHWSLALQLLHQGRMQHIQPNRIMFHSAIVACEGQQWRWSIYLLEEALSWRVIPDAPLLSAVMNSCEKGHQWTVCLQLLSTSFRSQCTPDLPMLTTSISACANSHRWEATLQLVREAHREIFCRSCQFLTGGNHLESYPLIRLCFHVFPKSPKFIRGFFRKSLGHSWFHKLMWTLPCVNLKGWHFGLKPLPRGPLFLKAMSHGEHVHLTEVGQWWGNFRWEEFFFWTSIPSSTIDRYHIFLSIL